MLTEELEAIATMRGWKDREREILERVQDRLERHLPEGEELQLTSFQRKVVHDPSFWRDWDDPMPTHCMVQGSTSSGKTLLSELSILDAYGHGERKTIVLVPLKAMVRERAEQLRHDFAWKELKVFGSSADFIENDEAIIEGDYDIAVIVYEKFFAMMSQETTKVMKDCGLVVVDELSMLSKEQRGPKLEISVETVCQNYKDVRILCLATCDCDTSQVCQWLDIEKPIFSTARPVTLEENILRLNGKGDCRIIPKDTERDVPCACREVKIDVPGYGEALRREDKRRLLLKAVLRRELERNPDAKILVFSSTRKGAASLAKYILDELREHFRPMGSSEFRETRLFRELEACDHDDEQNELINRFIPCGIAYHHAGISTTLREIIEDEFQREDSPLRLIVATETLTIGVNMPFDVMIVSETQVPKGAGKWEDLTEQEYRNFIGRAGRLGHQKDLGISYVFVDSDREAEKYKRSYGSTEKVTSALTNADELAIAPYLLCLLANRPGKTNFKVDDLRELYHNSLGYVCNHGRDLNVKRVLGELENYRLVEQVTKKFAIKAPPSFNLTEVGRVCASYAFSLETDLSIYGYFYAGGEYGGLPSDLTAQEVENDVYLLDILYHICLNEEVGQTMGINFPTGLGEQKARRLVRNALREILDSGTDRLFYEYYRGTELEEDAKEGLYELLHENNLVDSPRRFQAAYRAIVLYHWTKGLMVPELKKKTGFSDFTLVSGDIERLAEVVSFHLDAVYKCLQHRGTPNLTATEEEDASNALYSLQTRVKYGMPRDLVQLANKHIHGLDRSRLLRLWREAMRCGEKPVRFLYVASPRTLDAYLTPIQCRRLKQALEARGVNRSKVFKGFLNTARQDAGSRFKTETTDALKQIDEWDGSADPHFLYQEVEQVITSGDVFKGLILRSHGADPRHIVIEKRSSGACVCLGVLSGKDAAASMEELSRDFFRQGQFEDRPHLVLVARKGSDDENSYSQEHTELMRSLSHRGDTDAVLDNAFLASLLVMSIQRGWDDGEALFEFLSDARGVFEEASTLDVSLESYVREAASGEGEPAFRLVIGNRRVNRSESLLDVAGLKTLLANSDALSVYQTLPLGSSLEEAKEVPGFLDTPLVLMVKRDEVMQSRSLTSFLYWLRNHDFVNCRVIFSSEDEQTAWNYGRTREWETGCEWYRGFVTVPQVVVKSTQEAYDAIREFVENWEPKGFLIGICYPGYDQKGETIPGTGASDNELLLRLAERLGREYGQHRILYNHFKPARDHFPVDGGKRNTQELYRRCRVNLILWNRFTEENENCQGEVAAIRQGRREGQGVGVYLKLRPDDPSVPADSYSMAFGEDELDDVVDFVGRMLRDPLDGSGSAMP